MTSFVNDNGQEIQIKDDVLITKQVASFKNFKIKGDVSISFSIPNNSNNREALNYYGLNQIDSPIFSTNSFNLVKNGNTLMRGNIIIESDNEKELSIYFISGNANWFKSFDFSTKDIRNSRYNTFYNYTSINASSGNTSGIVFPHIDWMYKRQKFDRYSFCSLVLEPQIANAGGVALYAPVNISPCIYMSTVVEEIAKIAGIKIAGNLLDEYLYKYMIITPEGPDLYNEFGQVSTYQAYTAVTQFNTTLRIQDVVPDLKAIDIIRFLCFSFGCVPVFDEFSKTLTLNILDKINKEDAEDWSDYIKGYTIRYDQYQNNYIRNKQPDDAEIAEYDTQNDLPYGDLNIESEKNDGSTIELYISPFNAVKDGIGDTDLQWATPFVPFYDLEDDESYTFATVTNNGGKAQFDATIDFSAVGIGSAFNIVIRVNDGVYKGYHNIISASSTQVTSNADFISTDSGEFYVQTVSKVQRGPSVLVAVPNFPVRNFTSATSFNVEGIGDISNVMYAYWAKPFFKEYINLRGKKLGLAYGEIEGVIDLTIEEHRLNKIKAILGNPTVEATMLLPEAVFNSYNFDKFVRINYKNLSGYFFVDKIQNYKDGQTLVRVDLLYAD